MAPPALISKPEEQAAKLAITASTAAHHPTVRRLQPPNLSCRVCQTPGRSGPGYILGSPTDDKPAVTLETPRDPDLASSFLNIRVSDIHAVHAEWSARGADFLTPPKQHETEIRCYLRDPDGYLIEVGQTTLPGGWRQFLNP